MIATTGGLAVYAACDMSALGRWPVWGGALVVWAISEAGIHPCIERSTTHG